MQKGYSPQDGYSPQEYWDGLLGEQFDESGVAYQQLAPSFSRAMYKALCEATSSLQLAHGSGERPRRVLDIGAGTGVWIDFWASAGAGTIHGVDLTPVAVAGLRKKYPEHTFECVDIGEPGFGHRAEFDVISAMSILLHIVDEVRWCQALQNISDALAPRGYAVLIEPVLCHDWNGAPFTSSSNSRARHLSVYRNAAADAGLEIVDVRPATVLLANPIDSRSRFTHVVMEKTWHLLNAFVGTNERRGRAAGSVLSTIDPVLRRALPNGPSAKLMLLRRNG